MRNCSIWFPTRYSLHLKPLLTIEILEPIENIDLFFFRIPDNRSKIKFALKGDNHTAVFFSNRRLMLYTRMVHKNCYMTVGEAVFIGGGTISLDNTTMTIGASGLWSNGILIQGTDSHGIVDLDTMEIINAEPKHVILKRRVWLGRMSRVMKNVTIEEGSIVATGSIVVKDVPKACAVAGVPAKIVKERVSWSHHQNSISEYDKRQLLKLRNEIATN